MRIDTIMCLAVIVFSIVGLIHTAQQMTKREAD